MNENISLQDRQTNQSTESNLGFVQALLKQDRTRGLQELDNLFRSGSPPQRALDGRYRGELIALEIAPGLTQFFQWLTNLWMPWLGKTFQATEELGDNIFTRDSYLLARVFNPFYRGIVNDTTDTYRCFQFRTYTAPGLFDSDRSVLKIDYNLGENPSLTVRRILDELVQLDDELYLGKAHVQWWWGHWQTVAFFTLTKDMASLPIQ